MTTAAMVLGVAPLLYASGAGAAARFSMGLVIASGMSIGTVFTLFVVPMFYTFISKETARASRAEEKYPHRQPRRRSKAPDGKWSSFWDLSDAPRKEEAGQCPAF